MKRKVLEGLNSAKLVELLKKDPSIASKFDEYSLWNRIYPISWSWLLYKRPQFAEKAKQYPSGWAAILTHEPELARDCDKWEEFNVWNWYKLLDQPQFEEKAKQYPSGWAAILTQKPELARDCDKWEKFSAEDWSSLLKFQPQFADMRNKQI